MSSGMASAGIVISSDARAGVPQLPLTSCRDVENSLV
jgi:hypothetical protein